MNLKSLLLSAVIAVPSLFLCHSAIAASKNVPLPSDIVTLSTQPTQGQLTCAPSNTRGFRLIPPDGSGAEPTEFSIPPGKVLIITKVVWSDFINDLSPTVGNQVQLRLARVNPAFGGTVLALEMSGTVDSDGSVFASETIPDGLVVTSGTFLCASGWDLPSVSLYGYLADDK